MKRVVVLTIFLALFVALSPASAITLSGRATPGGTPTWNVFHGLGGMLLITVHWKSRNSILFLVGACDDGSTFVSGSMADRFTQIQIEVDPDTRCEVQARSRRGTSKFWINFQGTGMFGPVPQQAGVAVTGSTHSPLILDELAKLGKDRPPPR